MAQTFLSACFGAYSEDRAVERVCAGCSQFLPCRDRSRKAKSNTELLPPYNDSPPTAQESDGSTATYYELPPEARELQDIIAFLNCNAQMGEIGRAWMRYGRCPHSPKKRDIKKIIFYAQAELARLEKYEESTEC